MYSSPCARSRSLLEPCRRHHCCTTLRRSAPLCLMHVFRSQVLFCPPLREYPLCYECYRCSWGWCCGCRGCSHCNCSRCCWLSHNCLSYPLVRPVAFEGGTARLIPSVSELALWYALVPAMPGLHPSIGSGRHLEPLKHLQRHCPPCSGV